MKINKFLMGLGFVAAASLTACQSDEPANGGGNNGNPSGPEGDVAYMKISLRDVNQNNSRATTGVTDGGYQNGNQNEHKVGIFRK